MSSIERLFAWEALDSRGNPTVACRVLLNDGASGEATVPSGASTSRHEAHELRDGAQRYGGRGVQRAVSHVLGPIAQAVIGVDASDQAALDRVLCEADGTPDLSRLGANAVLAVSIAAAIAAASSAGEPLYRYLADDAAPLLPLPMVNMISGGAHAGSAIDVQDFLVVPVGATSFSQAMEWSVRVRAATAEAMDARGYSTALIADEGGLSAPLPSNRLALDLLMDGMERASLTPGEDVAIAIDVAATQLLDRHGRYTLAAEGRSLTSSELIEELLEWLRSYPIVSLEDVLGEDDWTGWAEATQRLTGCQLLGDDLFATNLARLQRGTRSGTANAVLVKPNQIGTLTAARTVTAHAQARGYATVLSARSGETEDNWLADLAVGWRTGQIKVGSTMRSERNAKWNRLLRLEAELGQSVEYAGAQALRSQVSPVAVSPLAEK